MLVQYTPSPDPFSMLVLYRSNYFCILSNITWGCGDEPSIFVQDCSQPLRPILRQESYEKSVYDFHKFLELKSAQHFPSHSLFLSRANFLSYSYVIFLLMLSGFRSPPLCIVSFSSFITVSLFPSLNFSFTSHLCFLILSHTPSFIVLACLS